MARGPLPFDGHRSMAEVQETERLEAEWDANPRDRRFIAKRLNSLRDRAWRNNPPLEHDEPANEDERA